MSVNLAEAPGRTLVLHYTPPLLDSACDELAGLKGPFESALAKLPKYTATVLDAVHSDGRAFKYTCEVFIVAQGMELDWLVSTPEGQAQVIAGAEAARVFLVTLNRGHCFASAEQVQTELTPWIRSLVPRGNLPPVLHPDTIPYTTTPQGIGHRTVLLETASQINGPIVVEDIRLVEPGKNQPTTFRRMVFLDTPSLIQSEAVLVHSGNELELRENDAGVTGQGDQRNQDSLGLIRQVSDTGLDAPAHASVSGTCVDVNSRGSGQNRTSENGLERGHRKTKRRKVGGGVDAEVRGLDTEGALSNGEESGFQTSTEAPLDASPAIVSQASAKADSASCPQPTESKFDPKKQYTEATSINGALPIAASQSGQSDGQTPGRNDSSRQGLEVLTGVDFSYLVSEYLQAMVAGLSFLAADLDDRTANEGLLDVLVVGLGGGGMPMFLRRHLGCRVEVIEIDPTVVHLATTYFGVSCDRGFQVHVADAIPWIIDAAANMELVSSSKGGRGSFDAVLIDVESAGGQCPPPAFLAPTFLSATRCLLRPGGLVAMNVVADDEGREAVHGAFQKVFGGRLYEWTVPQDSNHVLFARRTPDAAARAQAQPVQNPVSAPLTSHRESGAQLTCQDVDVVSDEDDFDLVYWASRLVEKGIQMRPWGRGPDLPVLASDIRPWLLGRVGKQ